MPKDLTAAVNQDALNPYSGGAWMMLCEIVIPGQTTQRLARNTADVEYDSNTFTKHNLDIGDQTFSGDGSIPQITLKVFQDQTKALETIINDSYGAQAGSVKLIKVGANFLDTPIPALEADYDILGAESDSSWVTLTFGIPNPLTQRIPLRRYSSSMCWKATPLYFKGPECKYAGAATSCTGTYKDCKAKGNAVNWGGFLGLDKNGFRIV